MNTKQFNIGDRVRHNQSGEVATIRAKRLADGYEYEGKVMVYKLDFGKSVKGPFRTELNGEEFRGETLQLVLDNPSLWMTTTVPTEDEDPTLTEQEKRNTLARLWAAAWCEALSDPEGTRVIVDTAEEDPSAPNNQFGRYYMIDGSTRESGIDHAGQWIVIRSDMVDSPFEIRRPNWHYLNGYADDWTQLACRCENTHNVVRWIERMINAGRITDIYADSY